MVFRRIGGPSTEARQAETRCLKAQHYEDQTIGGQWPLEGCDATAAAAATTEGGCLFAATATAAGGLLLLLLMEKRDMASAQSLRNEGGGGRRGSDDVHCSVPLVSSSSASGQAQKPKHQLFTACLHSTTWPHGLVPPYSSTYTEHTQKSLNNDYIYKFD